MASAIQELMMAINHGEDIDSTKQKIANVSDSDINFQPGRRINNSALHMAASRPYPDAIYLLLEKPSLNLLLTNAKEQTAWDIAHEKAKTNHHEAKQAESLLYYPTLLQAAKNQDMIVLSNMLKLDNSALRDPNTLRDLRAAARTNGEDSPALGAVESFKRILNREQIKLEGKRTEASEYAKLAEYGITLLSNVQNENVAPSGPSYTTPVSSH